MNTLSASSTRSARPARAARAGFPASIAPAGLGHLRTQDDHDAVERVAGLAVTTGADGIGHLNGLQASTFYNGGSDGAGNYTVGPVELEVPNVPINLANDLPLTGGQALATGGVALALLAAGAAYGINRRTRACVQV